jgi:hypothetical protein
MLTIGALLFWTLAAASPPAPATGLRSDSSSLSAKIAYLGPWCHQRPRVQLTLTNESKSDVWIAIEKPSTKPIHWIHYSYFQGNEGAASCGNADGDFLKFLRSGKSTRLAPGGHQTWILELETIKMRPGKMALTINGPVEGTRDLSDDHFAFYAFEARLSVNLVRAGFCYSEKGG